LQYVGIAKYGFDPGLQIGDRVNVVNLVWDKISENPTFLKCEETKSFSFEAIVTIRKYKIQARNFKDEIFSVQIGLKLTDNEQLPELAEIIKNNLA
jgi:hypothetical protein